MVALTHPPAYTLPEMAGKMGISLWALEAILKSRPDLAGLIWRCGGRRMITASNLPQFKAALAERQMIEAEGVGGQISAG